MDNHAKSPKDPVWLRSGLYAVANPDKEDKLAWTKLTFSATFIPWNTELSQTKEQDQDKLYYPRGTLHFAS